VLTATLTASQPRVLFNLGAFNDWFTTPQLTATVFAAADSPVLASLRVGYEEGGETVATRALDSGDWQTLVLAPDPAKGPIFQVELRLQRASNGTKNVTVYLEELLGIPDGPLEFERSASVVGSWPPADIEPGWEAYTVGDVSWLGPGMTVAWVGPVQMTPDGERQQAGHASAQRGVGRARTRSRRRGGGSGVASDRSRCSVTSSWKVASEDPLP
jgi:hypothetical protein